MLTRCLFTIFLLLLSGSLLMAQPAAPQLQSPPDGATDQPTTITFQWSSADGADRYQIQVAEDSGFNSVIKEQSTNSTSITLSNFSHSTTYYWRVRAGENTLLIGINYGSWSETRNFTTVEAAPPAPALVSPDDGATGVSTTPLLDWKSADRADTYQLQVDQTSDFSSPIIDRTGISATEEQVSGLQSKTTHYWRVRASNKGGTGNWSATRNFTTAEARPSVVQLVAPGNGATGVSTTPLLDWEPADRADVYDLHVATDKNFNNKVINLNNVVSTKYEADLKGFTTYYWRARGDNDHGPGAWSQVWEFTTDQTGNAITIISPSDGNLWKARQTFTIRWDAANNVDNVTIEYQLDPGGAWNVITENLDASSEIYGWTIPDISSPQAHIRISDSGNPDINTVSEPFIIYPKSIQLQKTYSFNSASSVSDYQLIGLPTQASIPLDELISGEPGKDWNAYYDNGSQENYLVAFDSSAQFTLEPGRAFFVITRNDVAVSENAPSVELSEDTTFAIPLHKGWNMIANPFGVTIPWENVLNKNGISSALWSFGGSYSEVSQFEPYKGYYFFNQDNLNELVIPYQPTKSSASNKHIEQSEKQILTLKVLDNGTEKSSIQVGLDRGLKSSGPATYQFAPPGNFQDHKLTIKSEKFGGRQAYLAKEFRPAAQTEQTFSLSLESLPDKPVTLKAEGINDFPSHEVVLVDRQTSKTFNLKRQKELFLKPEQSESRYLLIIGTAKQVEEAANQFKPTTFTLSQNYPNPFNGQTVIEYTIPEETSNTTVRLEIFDVLGRKVATLVNEQQASGHYEVRWDAQNAQGKLLSSGTYFYRLNIGSKVKTKQLTLIK